MSVRSATLGVAVAVASAAAGEAAAQELTQRVAAVETGSVTFTYAARPEAQICDRGISIRGGRVMWGGRNRGDFAMRCTSGTVSVELRVAGGLVREVDVLELDDVVEPETVDLGTVSAEEAAAYFLSLARADGSDDAAEDAVLAAVLADVDAIWRELLEIARDSSIPQDVRSAALFWLGQEAGDAVTSGIAAIAADEREEQDVREAAIFALSQRPDDVGVEPLMELARTAREAETRRAAMFWLAQSDDPRVLAFFEEVLLGR
jgi:hypothetical protein